MSINDRRASSFIAISFVLTHLQKSLFRQDPGSRHSAVKGDLATLWLNGWFYNNEMPWYVFLREPLSASRRFVVFPTGNWNGKWRRRQSQRLVDQQREYWRGKCLEMSRGSSLVRLACLLWFLSPYVCAQDRTTYVNKFRRGLAGRSLRRRNAYYSSYLRTNNSWLPKINPMAFSYNRANQWNQLRRVRHEQCKRVELCFVPIYYCFLEQVAIVRNILPTILPAFFSSVEEPWKLCRSTVAILI